MSIRYVTPVPRRAATGRVADVYAQSASEFGQAAFMMLSPAPELHAATWAFLRESEVAGDASRTNKELVAVAVSLANECRFCIDAHTIMVHAAGEHELAEDVLQGRTPSKAEHAKLVAWATATCTPGVSQLGEPPFPAEHAAEYIGTALSTHFTNRMFSALTNEQLMPGNLQRSHTVRRAGGLAYGRIVRRRHASGASLPLLADVPLGPEPAWAAGTPIGTAFAALRGAAATGGALLNEASREIVRVTVDDWDGLHRQVPGAWIDQALAKLPPAERPAARLALLAAVAPHHIFEADVTAWQKIDDVTDADLVHLLSFGAIAAVDRLERGIVDQIPALRSAN